ncbi:hypothetical protein [Poriferisphaera sp. WC338]|uniref:hypothetical protein n=1 Tax=Poriferisphaera sp. WC338 TaxID=3425129 RepID=UPI003D8134CA
MMKTKCKNLFKLTIGTGMAVATFTAASQTYAAPVAFELTGVVSSSTIDTFNTLPGNVSVGDTITTTIVYDLDRATSNGAFLSGGIGLLTLTANGETLDFTQEFTSPDRFNSLGQLSDIRLGRDFVTDDYFFNLADRDEEGDFLEFEQVGIRLQVDGNTFNSGDPFALLDVPLLDSSEGVFNLTGDDSGVSSIRVTFNELDFIDVPDDYVFSDPTPPIPAVPSPTALSAIGLLIPLSLRRTRKS